MRLLLRVLIDPAIRGVGTTTGSFGKFASLWSDIGDVMFLENFENWDLVKFREEGSCLYYWNFLTARYTYLLRYLRFA